MNFSLCRSRLSASTLLVLAFAHLALAQQNGILQSGNARITVITPNLSGTLRTLDGVSGATDVGEGILSRDGWYLLDDSKTPLLTTDGWVRSRPKDAGTDWYLFGYGTDYRAALKSLTTISGPVPLPRKSQLCA